MIRLAEERDVHDLTRMAFLFHQQSPYADLTISEEKVNDLVYSFFNTPDRIAIVLEDKYGGASGVLAALATEMLFSREKIATEVMWWIDPEHRGYKDARGMVDAYEFWAKKIGAKYTQLVSVDDKDKFYRRMGYAQTEHAYIKVL